MADNIHTALKDAKDCKGKYVLKDAMEIGSTIYGKYDGVNVWFGMCQMIGELQQEVSNLKSQLNIIEKNL